MATVIREAPETVNPLDVSRAELWREDRWQEPMRRLRAESPIHYCEDSKFGPYWSVTTYKPIQHVEALPKLFSSSWEYGGITVAGDGVEHLQEGEIPMPMFIAMDPPQHTAQRRTVAPAFGPSETERMRTDTLKRTSDVLDSLPVGEPFDWVEKLSIELTTQMLAILFDFPWEERHDLRLWSDMFGEIKPAAERDPERVAQFMAEMQRMLARFDALMADRRAQPPSDDLLSRMVHSEAMGNLSPFERVSNLALLIVGGNDTTRNSMSGLIEALHHYPEELDKLREDDKLIPNAAQEIIRWQSPVTHMRRTALADAEVGGQRIAKGDKVVLWYISANRDESMFPEAERFDVTRANARRHLAFGHGVHRCVQVGITGEQDAQGIRHNLPRLGQQLRPTHLRHALVADQHVDMFLTQAL